MDIKFIGGNMPDPKKEQPIVCCCIECNYACRDGVSEVGVAELVCDFYADYSPE